MVPCATTWRRDHPFERGAAASHRQRIFHGCNAWIDRQIGRVIDAVNQLHGNDTAIIYASDHGDMLGAHGGEVANPFVYWPKRTRPTVMRRWALILTETSREDSSNGAGGSRTLVPWQTMHRLYTFSLRFNFGELAAKGSLRIA